MEKQEEKKQRVDRARQTSRPIFIGFRRLINEKDAARYIGMSVSFLRQSRMTGKLKNRTPGPPFVKYGKAVRYRLQDLDDWIMKHLQEF